MLGKMLPLWVCNRADVPQGWSARLNLGSSLAAHSLRVCARLGSLQESLQPGMEGDCCGRRTCAVLTLCIYVSPVSPLAFLVPTAAPPPGFLTSISGAHWHVCPSECATRAVLDQSRVYFSL